MESSYSESRVTARASAEFGTPDNERSNSYAGGPDVTYVGRRARVEAGEALSVAALRERLALESYHRMDPAGAPVVARALAVMRDGAIDAVRADAVVAAELTSPADLAAAADLAANDVAVEVIGSATRGSRHGVPRGRRRSTRSDALSVFRVPAPSPAPGSRVAVARRRATAAARRRPLLLSTPVLVAALMAGGSAGVEQLTASGDSTSTAAASSSAGASGLSQSDVRVSRSKRDASSINLGGVGIPAGTPGLALPDPAALPDATPLPAAVVETATPVPEPPAPPVAAPTWFRPVEGGYMNSCFCTRWGSFHDGIDIDPPLGTPIVAVGDGTVVSAGPVSGYGIGIYIQHADGSVSFYGHMAIYYVKTGDVVTAGEEIALVGNEGFSTGPHLHFSVFSSWDNGARTNAIDPVPWLAERGIDMGAYNPNG